MKPEEKALTEAIDGISPGKLPEPLLREKESWDRLRPALRASLTPPPFEHAEFLRERVLSSLPRRESRPPRWQALMFGGLGAVSAAVVLAMLLLTNELSTTGASNSTVLEVHTSDPQISVAAFAAPKSRGVVIWLEHAGYIPPDETIR